MNELVPVTVIGGYLGAGKTTLLNRLLAGDHGRRLAVLVNDFGSVNIDADLVTAHDGDTISLQNGCICCSIADALGDALDGVLALDPPPDQIVIEASGVADPAKVAHYGRGWPGCRLDAVVALADTETIRRRARDEFVGELVLRQLGAGDLVVLTKVDLVPAETVEEVRSWAAERVGESVPVVESTHGDVDSSVLLDLGAAGHTADRRPPSSSVDATDRFRTITIALDGPLSRPALERALEDWPEAIVRVKGVVELDAGLAVVQRVGRRWSIEPWTDDRPSPRELRLVLVAVAETLDEDAARAMLLG